LARQFSIQELVTAALLPTPYLLISFLYPLVPPSAEAPNEGPTIEQLTSAVFWETQNSRSSIPSTPGSLQTFALASITLLALGGYSKLRSRWDDDSFTKDGHANGGSSDQYGVNLTSLRDGTLKVLSVGLPLYASMKLGGVKVGLLMLVAAASSISSGGTSLKSADLIAKEGWKRVLRTGPLLSVIFALGVVFDGFFSLASGVDMIMGYAALFTSIFLVLPPFMNRTSSAAHSFEVSPLISSNTETNMTLFVGLIGFIVSLLLGFVFNVFPSGIYDLGLFSLSTLGGAASFALSTPFSLQNPPYFGLILGSYVTFTSALFTASAANFQALIAQAVLTAAGYGAVQLDRRRRVKKDSHDSHHHDHSTHSHKAHAPSAFSKVLLNIFHEWPLLHSILLERDSRRIFYFMR
jgi:solute carrier family 30 (zinc transporter), member 5/7